MTRAGYDFVENVGWKLFKDIVGLEQEKEQMDPIGHEDDQPMGDTMMEDAPADIASLRDEVSILRNELCQRHLTTVDNQALNEDDDIIDDYDEDEDSNKYIVSTIPPIRKLVIFDVNGFLAYISRNPKEKDSNIREYLENLWNAPNVPDFVRNNSLLSD
ncbi:hypothetical protein F3Y22_tig00112231pilonHSYRG00073 [Hibiscus syriacus]|uniref:FCP1 homology domain-containing protein n=1 Tax=Hibiscus syriacus TaxID=106335 RepID=A0A6A2X3W4_HIBSY|nr:hypothetical protein F3Y22_tig00112231pilonHSYRG00073 [Hibiscus syriacus]